MERLTCTQRPNYVPLVQSQGLVYTHDTDPSDPLHMYWREGVHYSFKSDEIQAMEAATAAVFDMCIEAGDWMVAIEQRAYLQRLKIPVFALKQVIETWNQEPAYGSVYGRFDLRFGGFNHPDPSMRVPKFYEFNADTPTSLVESAVIQWNWLEQTGEGRDQWNSITEGLAAAWKRNLELIERKLGHRPVVHFAASDAQTAGEDEMNVILMLDTCRAAGYEAKTIYIENIVLGDDGRFYDEQGSHIDVIFKLYPWEHLVHDEFGRAVFADMDNIGVHDEHGNYTGGTIWIEPPYKMLWSNKAIMAVLWKLFADDPRGKYLIPTWFEDEAPTSKKGYARKPLLSREGADITLLNPDGSVLDEYKRDEYGEEGFVLQELTLPPVYPTADGKQVSVVIGSWVIDGEPAGIGIRESYGPITDDFANFVPHSISDGPLMYARQPIPALQSA